MHRWYCVVAFLASIRSVTAVECNKNKEIQVQKPSTPPESNGCSKPSFIQVNGEEDFTYCCDRHDACYGMCGSDKTFCDKDFGNCLRRMCKTNFPHNPECAGAAGTYEMGTMFAGQQGYAESQEQYCICIPKDEADGVFFTAEETHYMSLVEDFYKKYATTKDSPKSPEELVTSYSRTKKQPLYKLYYDLHKKYDQAIKHVDSRKTMNPPRPPAKQPNAEKQAKVGVTEDKGSDKGGDKGSNKHVKQVVDDEVLDTLGKQFESRKEFFESQKVGTHKQVKTDKKDSKKDRNGESNKNSKSNSKNSGGSSKNSKNTQKPNQHKSRKEEEEIDNDEFNQEVQRKIQEIRRRKEQSTFKDPKPLDSGSHPGPPGNGRDGRSEKGSKDSTTVPVSVQQEL